MGCASVVIRIVQTGNQKLWLWFGVLAGIGLENKYSMAVFGLGIVLGLLLTPERKAFAHKWIWIAGGIAFLIFLPNLLWNVHRDWPFVQLMHNIHASGRDVELNPVQFFCEQILMVNPFALPLVAGGIGLAVLWPRRTALSRAGLGVRGYAGRLHGAARQGLLRRSGISHAVRCRQRGLRSMDRRGPSRLAQARLFVLVLLVPALVFLPLLRRSSAPSTFWLSYGRFTSRRPSASTVTRALRCRSIIPTNSVGRRWWPR